MKKFLVMLIAVCTVFTLASCGTSETAEPDMRKAQAVEGALRGSQEVLKHFSGRDVKYNGPINREDFTVKR